jgi:ketosteroid isomerase-like protein
MSRSVPHYVDDAHAGVPSRREQVGGSRKQRVLVGSEAIDDRSLEVHHQKRGRLGVELVHRCSLAHAQPTQRYYDCCVTNLFSAALISVAMAACGPTAPRRATYPPQPTVALPPELARVLGDYERGWRASNVVALAALFTEDGLALSPGRPMVRGRAAIEEHYRNSGGPLTLRAVACAVDGNLAFIIGAFSSRADGVENGKFTLVLRRDPVGRWWIVSDMDNGNGLR